MEEHTMNDGQRLAGNGPGRRDAARACRRPAGLAVLAAAAVIGLAACGGGSGSPQVASLGNSSGTSGSGGRAAQPTGSPAKLLNEWAACMRKHGDPNQADPTIDSNKDIVITMSNVSQATQDAVNGGTGPCASYLLAAQKDLRGGQPAPTPNPAQGLKFDSCMRANGVPNWPDSGNGVTNLSAAGIDPNSPAFQKAMNTCHSKLGMPAAGTAPGMIIMRSCGTKSGISKGTSSTGAGEPSGGSGGSGSCANG